MLHTQNPFASLFNGVQPSPYARPTRGGFPYNDYYHCQPARSPPSIISLCRHCGEAHDPRDHFYKSSSSSRPAYHHHQPLFYGPDEEEDDAADTWARARQQRQVYEERLRQAELDKARRLAMQQQRQQYLDALRRQQQEQEEQARMRYLQQRQTALEEAYRRRQAEEEQLRAQAMEEEEARKQQEQRRHQAEQQQQQHRLQALSHLRQNAAARTIQRFMRTATLLRRIDAIARRFEELRGAFVFPASVDLQDDAAAAVAEPKLAYTQNNYAIHAFDDALSKLLVRLDGVESFGILAVRERRKQVVRMIESEAQALEERWKAAAKAQKAVQQQQQQRVDAEEIETEAAVPSPSSTESAGITAEDDVEEDDRMHTDEDEDEGAVGASAPAELSSISESMATLPAEPDVVPESTTTTTTTHGSSTPAGGPTHEHTGEPTSTPIDEQVEVEAADPDDEDGTSMILEPPTTTPPSSSLSSPIPTHSDAHRLTGTITATTTTTDPSTEPIEPAEPSPAAAAPSSTIIAAPESSAVDVDVNNGSVEGELTRFDDDGREGPLLSTPTLTPTPTTSALPIPDVHSSTSSSSVAPTLHLSPSHDVPLIAEDEDEDEEIAEVDRALAIPPGAEYASTEEDDEGEETWEDAWEELMPLEPDRHGDGVRFPSSSPSSSAATAMRQSESANGKMSLTSSEKEKPQPEEQTRISLLSASVDGEEDFEMV